LETLWYRIKTVTPDEFQAAVNLFTGLVNTHFLHDASALREPFFRADQQSRIAEVIHRQKEKAALPSYPYQREKDLQSLVAEGNRREAGRALNDILGSVLFKDPGNLPVIKTRIGELIVVLSRTVTEASREQDHIFQANREFLEKISLAESVDEICLIEIGRAHV
jgi:two-component system, response regulator YesN